MLRLKYFYSICFTALFVTSCRKPVETPSLQPFNTSPISVAVNGNTIDEVSGIADSKLNTGLWVEQDSGNPPEIYLLNYNGSFQKKIFLKGARNRDWEDILLSSENGGSIHNLYIADVGDNNAKELSYDIYRLPEPSLAMDTLNQFEKISFQYPDGSHDSESILVDNLNKNIYVLTKWDANSRIYKISYPQSTTTINHATFVRSLSFGGVVSASVSADNKELLVRNYNNIYYWLRDPMEQLEVTLSKAPTLIAYSTELQGEAICFKNDGTGFYTISERLNATSPQLLNFYKRK